MHIYAISIFYITKCGMAHTFNLILIITSYLNSQMGFDAWKLNILLSLEDEKCALMNVNLFSCSASYSLHFFLSNFEQVLLDASLTAQSCGNHG